MTLPVWFTCDPQTIKAESGLEAHQVTRDGLDSTMLADIATSFETVAKLLLSDLREAAGQLDFPTPDIALAIARPLYSPATRAERIESQKAQLIEATKGLVIAKLWYLVPSDGTEGRDGRAKGAWINGKSLQGALEKSLKGIARDYKRAVSVPFV